MARFQTFQHLPDTILRYGGRLGRSGLQPCDISACYTSIGTSRTVVGTVPWQCRQEKVWITPGINGNWYLKGLTAISAHLAAISTLQLYTKTRGVEELASSTCSWPPPQAPSPPIVSRLPFKTLFMRGIAQTRSSSACTSRDEGSKVPLPLAVASSIPSHGRQVSRPSCRVLCALCCWPLSVCCMLRSTVKCHMSDGFYRA